MHAFILHHTCRATGRHTVMYDDGDLRDYDMHTKEYQLLALPPARRCVHKYIHIIMRPLISIVY